MSPELIAILGVGIAIPGMILATQRSLRADLRAVNTRIDELGKSTHKQFTELRREIGHLRERMAHLEGLLEGLREAISGRRAAA